MALRVQVGHTHNIELSLKLQGHSLQSGNHIVGITREGCILYKIEEISVHGEDTIIKLSYVGIPIHIWLAGG